MVTKHSFRRRKRAGSLMIELAAATTLLAGALLPLAYSIAKERQVARATYQRAVAMEIVDGEMEILAAGGWRGFPSGRNLYRVNAAAATNLPPGGFWLTLETGRIQLEWKPTVKAHGGSVVREAKAK